MTLFLKLGRRFFGASLSAVLFIALTTTQTQARGCMTADEIAAEQVRRLQTTLMVGALQCRNQPDLKVREAYNSFVARYGAAITAHNRILTRYFQRTEGGGFQSVMDSHITKLANNISRIGHTDQQFCNTVAGLGQNSLKPDAGDIVTLARANVITRSDFENCIPSMTQAAQAGS